MIDLILAFFHSLEWKAPILSFIESKCMLFDNEEENKLEYTVAHNDFKELAEGLIEGMIKELGATNDQFGEAFESASQTAGFKKVSKILESVDSFEVFKKMMLKKNSDLNKEAAEILLAQEASIAQLKEDEAKPADVTKSPEPKARDPTDQTTPDGPGEESPDTKKEML